MSTTLAKHKPLPAHLTELGIDPHAWASARAAESDAVDYRLARDVEDLVEGAAYDRCVTLNEGENLLDIWAILWTAMSRWPLREAGAA